jgi:hypothetical protein
MAEPRLAPIDVRALDGRRLRIPTELPAERTLVLLAFRQWQQRDVDAWIALATALGVPASPLGSSEPLPTAVVEVPVLPRRYAPARRLIDGGMASSIGDPAVLARTLTAYTDVERVRRDCGLRTTDEVSALLVDRSGRASVHAEGPPTSAARTALAEALAEDPAGGTLPGP